jgi:hypothetical protein
MCFLFCLQAFENLAKARGFSNADLLGASNAVLEKV